MPKAPVHTTVASKDMFPAIFDDKRSYFDGSDLTFEERGVLIYILMKPTGWQITAQDLMREGKIGRDLAYKIINGLIKKGCVERVEIRDKGSYAGTITKLSE